LPLTTEGGNALSEPSKYRLYRANVNLPRMPNGSVHEIDDTDGRWDEWIRAGFISPVGPPNTIFVPLDEVEDLAVPQADGSSVEYVIGDGE
jgi:hypothetical protein